MEGVYEDMLPQLEEEIRNLKARLADAVLGKLPAQAALGLFPEGGLGGGYDGEDATLADLQKKLSLSKVRDTIGAPRPPLTRLVHNDRICPLPSPD
eukprot:715751-Prorocentrum_minimum.AAC.1